MNAAVIIARGGSTRLPRKNIKNFCGHPLVAWSIAVAKNSMAIDKVFVSTDDDEIQDISINYGAEVIRRPDWKNPNAISGNVPTLHAINEIQKRHPDLNLVIPMLPTCPLRKPEDLDKAIQLYCDLGADVVVPFIKNRETCIFKVVGKYRHRLSIFDKRYNYGTQTGSFSVCSPNFYRAMNEMLAEKVGAELHDKELDDSSVWPQHEYYFSEAEYWQYADVDTKEEFEFGELIMEHYILKGRGIKVYDDYKEEWQKALEDLHNENLDGALSKYNVNQL